jgi:hypothetical protein
VAWLIGATGLHHVSIEAVVAVGLMLLGASLVITGRTDWSLSRRSWPMWLGAGLIVLLVATSTTFGLGGALNNVSFGHMKAGATPTGQLPSGTIHGGFGNLTVDLTHATTSGTVRVVSVAGNTTVDLPPDAQVKVDARVVAGQISVNGQDTGNGLGAHDHETIGGGGPTTLTVDIRQIFGQILIDQGSNR